MGKLDKNGVSTAMPPLNADRGFHACGFYYEDDKLTYLVTGGWVSGISSSSTEIMYEQSQNWLTLESANLPSRRTGPRAISLNNDIFVTGNEKQNDRNLIFPFLGGVLASG